MKYEHKNDIDIAELHDKSQDAKIFRVAETGLHTCVESASTSSVKLSKL